MTTALSRSTFRLQWVPHWTRPFESDDSLQAKFAWLNELTKAQFEKVGHSIRNRAGAAHRLVHSPEIADIGPANMLVRTSLHSLMFCKSCLDAGYHSFVPQFAGMSECPIHRMPLSNKCGTCGRIIRAFGSPNFRKTAVYLCEHCRAALARADGILSGWTELSNDQIREAYTKTAPKLRRIAVEGAGFWHLHSVYAPAISRKVTDPEETSSNARSLLDKSVRLEKIVWMSSFELPMKERLLDFEIENSIGFDGIKLAHASKLLMEEQDWKMPGRRLPYWHSYESKLECPLDFDLVNGALAIREQLIADASRQSSVFPPVWAIGAPPESALVCHRQLRTLVAAHSLIPILVQLQFIQRMSACFNGSGKGVESGRRYCRKLSKLYAGTLELQSASEDRMKFQATVQRFLPSFQIRSSEKSISLRIFKLGPDFRLVDT